ncbi:MAG TPA: HAD family phosphatase [Acidimicrobiia bacterium]|nr:HAD family phosphatase [Acidimicrobiia bacterium]
MTLQAAIFDLGGVVLDSPLGAIAAFERRTGIPAGTVNSMVVATGDDGAWARHERGEVPHDLFLKLLRAEFEIGGHDIDTAALMADVDGSIRVRPRMVRLVDQLRRAGVRVAALTNNWTPFGPDGIARHFDVIVESVLEGTRKPERRIYEITLERLGVEAQHCVMLDDLGPNLKPARDMGMTTIKVTSVEQAIAEIDALFV